MKGKIIGLSIVVGFILVFSMFYIGTYNSLNTKDQEVKAKWSQIDNQLQRRYDLIPNLVSTVKNYAKHEDEIFVKIAEARNNLANAKTTEEKANANEQLNQLIGKNGAINVIVERYPDLKANENFARLQDELAGTENRISVARMDYNNAVKDFNSEYKSFFTNMFFSGKFQEKSYFEANVSAKENVNVDDLFKK